MKKFISFMILFVLILSGVVTAFASEGAGGNLFMGQGDAVEVREDMEIVLEDAAHYDITYDDLDLEHAIKDYIDIDIFEHNVKTAEEMAEYLSGAAYVYLLPPIVKDNGTNEDGTYYLTISRAREFTDEFLGDEHNFTEEEIAALKRESGRWIVPEVGLVEEWEDINADNGLKAEIFLQCYGIENSKTFFIGGLSYESRITAICFVEDGPMAAEEPYYVLLDKIEVDDSSAEDIKDAVYTYEEMKRIAWNYTEGLPDTGGGPGGISRPWYSRPYIYIAAAAVIVAGAVIALILVLRNKRPG